MPGTLVTEKLDILQAQMVALVAAQVSAPVTVNERSQGFRGTCNFCGKVGHKAARCRQRQQRYQYEQPQLQRGLQYGYPYGQHPSGFQYPSPGYQYGQPPGHGQPPARVPPPPEIQLPHMPRPNFPTGQPGQEQVGRD